MKIKITADSTLDLPQELIEKYNIGVAPMTIVMNGATYKDGVDITSHDIEKNFENGGVSVTSAINEAEYAELFDAWLTEYDAVVHINISSSMSACYQNATLASHGKPVYTVDSRNLSTSGGFLAMEGAELAASGTEPEEIARILGEHAYKIDASFVIDTLKYLHRGGRCSALAALGANVLKLKPCIEVNTAAGTMSVGKKYRGNFENVILQYIDDRLYNRNDIDTRIISVTRAHGTPEAIVEKVLERVKKYYDFDTVLTSHASSTIMNHCGPVCLGILFYTK